MKNTTRIIWAFILFFGFLNQNVNAQERIVSIGAISTELLSTLGLEDKIVGVDITSTYPASVKSKAQLGHLSGITLEAIISTKPDMVTFPEGKLNQKIVERLESLKIATFEYKQELTTEGAAQIILDFGKAFGKEKLANKEASKLREELAQLQSLKKNGKKILFIYSRGPRMLLVAGGNTAVSKLIELSGSQNVAQNIKDYKPLNTESLIEYNPDYIFFFSHSLRHFKSKEEVWKIQGMQFTTAGKKKQLISMDANLVSSFGPRLAIAIQTLIEKTK